MKTVFFWLYLILNSWVAGFTNNLTLGVQLHECYGRFLMPYRAWSFRSFSMNISGGLSTFSHLLSRFSQGSKTLLAPSRKLSSLVGQFSQLRKGQQKKFWAYLEHSWWINRWLPNWKTKLVLMTKQRFEMAFIVKLLPLQLPQ